MFTNFKNFENFRTAENWAEFSKILNFGFYTLKCTDSEVLSKPTLYTGSSLPITNWNFGSNDHSLAARSAESWPNELKFFELSPFP